MAFSSSAAWSAEGCLSASWAAASRAARIGAEQGQRAERAFDRAAQPVVDDDALEAVGSDTGDVIAGDRIAQLVVLAGRRR